MAGLIRAQGQSRNGLSAGNISNGIKRLDKKMQPALAIKSLQDIS
jgi:hypothetical protein